MKRVRIIDEGTTRHDSSEALANYLRTRFGGDIDVAVVDAVGAGLPDHVVQTLRAAGRSAPPALVVEGSLVAVGDLPTWAEAAELVTGGLSPFAVVGRGCCSDPGCRG